jgi:hypothetical protein
MNQKCALFAAFLLFILILGLPFIWSAEAQNVNQSRVYGNNLVGYWKFDEGSGSTVSDSSGRNNNGVAINGSAWVNGKYGSALSFDGSNYVELPKNLIMDGPAISFSIWFKTNLNGVIMGYQNSDYPDAGTNHFPAIYVGTDGKLYAALYVPNRMPIGTKFLVNDNNWHHVVLVANVNTQSLYLDDGYIGKLDGTIENLDMAVNYIGMSRWDGYAGTQGTWGFFTGSIDEAQIYYEALTFEQISSSSASPTNSSPIPASSSTPIFQSPTPFLPPLVTPSPTHEPPTISINSPKIDDWTVNLKYTYTNNEYYKSPRIDVDWGDGLYDYGVWSPSGTSTTHTYSRVGVFQIKAIAVYSVFDSTSGYIQVSVSATTTVEVGKATTAANNLMFIIIGAVAACEIVVFILVFFTRLGNNKIGTSLGLASFIAPIASFAFWFFAVYSPEASHPISGSMDPAFNYPQAILLYIAIGGLVAAIIILLIARGPISSQEERAGKGREQMSNK